MRHHKHSTRHLRIRLVPFQMTFQPKLRSKVTETYWRTNWGSDQRSHRKITQGDPDISFFEKWLSFENFCVIIFLWDSIFLKFNDANSFEREFVWKGQVWSGRSWAKLVGPWGLDWSVQATETTKSYIKLDDRKDHPVSSLCTDQLLPFWPSNFE